MIKTLNYPRVLRGVERGVTWLYRNQALIRSVHSGDTFIEVTFLYEINLGVCSFTSAL